MRDAWNKKLTLVVLTHNRCAEVMCTLRHLRDVAPKVPIVVVDNASADGTSECVRQHFPKVRLIRTKRNMGAAARNIGVQNATTPYVALCDDDTRWDAGALNRAASTLDIFPNIAVVNAAVYVGVEQRPDPACKPMFDSVLDSTGLPGKRLAGFMAGAVIVRVSAFKQAGGFFPDFFIGGEEDLLALDLMHAGWDLVFMPQVTTCHFPSVVRQSQLRRKLLARNRIWLVWLRLPVRLAVRHTMLALRSAHRDTCLPATMWEAVVGLPAILRQRAVVSPYVSAMWARTHDGT